jgi:DNA-binding GntR family transcriptional regulator
MPVNTAFPGIGIQPSPSIPERIAAVLRRDIVTAEIDPDTAIKQIHIAQRFGVSQAPVREALNQLIAEHLVVHYPNKGVRVAPLLAAELQEAASLRVTLETELVRKAMVNFTDADAVVAETALDRIGKANNVGDLMAAHEAFHDAIYEPAGAPITLDIVQGLRARCSRYLGFMWKHSDKGRLSFSEHRKLLDLVLAGDADKTASFLREHISASTDATVTCLEGR